MTAKRSFNFTIPILAVGLLGMCSFLWFEYRLAKQKARPAPTSVEANSNSSTPSLTSNRVARLEVIERLQRSLAGSPNALNESQAAQLKQLFAARGTQQISPEIIFGAQSFLSPTQLTALKSAFAESKNHPAPTPLR